MADPTGFEPDPPGFEADVPASLGQRAGRALSAGHQYVANILHSIDTLGGRLPGSPSGSFISPESVNPVPRDLTEAGAQTAQMILPAGAIARSGLGGGWQALTRILSSAIGGEVGNRLEGGPAGRGIVTQGIPAVASEAIGAGLMAPSVLRAISNNPIAGGKQNIANAYQENVGRTIGEIVPELGTPKTGEDFAALARLARGTRLPAGMSQQPGHEEALGGMLDVAAANIKHLTGDQPLHITQLPPGVVAGVATPVTGGTLLDATGRPVTNVSATSGRTMPFDQALGTLRALYGRAYNTGTPVTNPAIAALDPVTAKVAAEALKQEISAELQRISPEARNLFQTSQNKYGIGLEIASDIDRALRLSPNRTELSEPALQQAVFNRLGEVSAKLGRHRVTEDVAGDALQKYLAAIYRNGGLGKTIPSTGTGTASDSFRRAYAQGQGGTPAAIAAIPKALLENAGARYTGQRPYSLNLPPVLQQALDLALQRQTTGVTP